MRVLASEAANVRSELGASSKTVRLPYVDPLSEDITVSASAINSDSCAPPLDAKVPTTS